MQITKHIKGKPIVFRDVNISKASAVVTGKLNYSENLNLAIDHFMQQKNEELKIVLYNLDRLEVFLTTGSNIKIGAPKVTDNTLKEKVGKIYLNIDWFLSLS